VGIVKRGDDAGLAGAFWIGLSIGMVAPGTIGMVALLIANVLLDRKGLLTSQQRSSGARLNRP